MDSSTPDTTTPSTPATPAPAIPPATVAAATPAPVSALPYHPGADTAYLDATQVASLRRAQSGANWLYWIAGMSLVNTAMIYFKAGTSFAIGLFFTQIIDYGVRERSPMATYVGLGLDAV